MDKDLIIAAKKIQTWIHTHPRKATIVQSVIDEFDKAISDAETSLKDQTIDFNEMLNDHFKNRPKQQCGK